MPEGRQSVSFDDAWTTPLLEMSAHLPCVIGCGGVGGAGGESTGVSAAPVTYFL